LGARIKIVCAQKLMKEDRLKSRTVIAMLFFIPLMLWVGAEAKTASPAPKGSAAEGEKVFKANCAMCHNADKTDAKMGPGLKGLFKNKELPASHKPVTEENVREQIMKGNANAKPIPMPAFADKLKPQEIDSLIQYLKTL
jgi:cytochrome c